MFTLPLVDYYNILTVIAHNDQLSRVRDSAHAIELTVKKLVCLFLQSYDRLVYGASYK